MDAPFSIRPLEPSERDAAVALWHAVKLTRPWNDPEADFDRALEGPTSTVLGAFDRDRLIATAMAGDDGHRGWIYYVAVDKRRRGEGLGRTIVAAAEAWLTERGVHKAQLMVRKDNGGAIEFWDRLGYANDQVVVMGRRLTELPEHGFDHQHAGSPGASA